MKQIKPSEIKIYRDMYAKKQNYICPICKKSLAVGLVALDHDHGNEGGVGGRLRGTIHASCNSAIGRMSFGAQHLQKVKFFSKTNYLEFLENTLAYLKEASINPKKVIHNTWDVDTNKQKPKKRKKK